MIGSDITDAQLRKMIHALGWSKDKTPTARQIADPYRNYYSTTIRDPEWDALEMQGLATARPGYDRYWIYHVTAAGKTAILARYPRYIVRLSKNHECYLTSGNGNSERTCHASSAKRFKTQGSARHALNASLKHRKWNNAVILEVSP